MDEAMENKIKSCGDWLTGFTIDGVKYGGNYLAETDPRLLGFIERIGKRLENVERPRILECGCFEGGHTTTMAQLLSRAIITAVDVRPETVRKAKILAEARACSNIAFKIDDFDDQAESLNASYEGIFCVGLLYHLRKPDVFLKKAAKAAPYLWLWTVYCAEAETAVAEGAFRGRIYAEPVEHPLSAVRPESFFPTLGSLLDMLWAAGYKHIDLVRQEMTANGNGPAILLEATL